MHDYESRRQARIERLHQRADAARRAAEQAHDQARRMADVIPFGQPILIGHHSERRDRAYRARIENTFRRAFETLDKAKYYDERAAAAEDNRAISSDDPEAIAKLRAKLAELEQFQARMKTANAIIRSKPKNEATPDKLARLVAAGLSEAHARELFTPDCCGRIGFAAYQLSNNNANMARVRERIGELERRDATPEAAPVELAGLTVSEDRAWGRILIAFDRKPPAEVCQLLRRHGWRWARTAGAWVRHLNGTGQASAHMLAPKLAELIAQA